MTDFHERQKEAFEKAKRIARLEQTSASLESQTRQIRDQNKQQLKMSLKLSGATSPIIEQTLLKQSTQSKERTQTLISKINEHLKTLEPAKTERKDPSNRKLLPSQSETFRHPWATQTGTIDIKRAAREINRMSAPQLMTI